MKITYIIRNLPLIIICFLFSFYYLIADFSINVVLLVVFITIIEVAVCLLSGMKGTIVLSKLSLIILLIFLTIILNLRNGNYLEEQPFYLFSLLLVAFVFFFVKSGFYDRKMSLMILLISSSIVCCFVIASRFLPGLYKVILGVISQESRDYSEWLLGIGYSGAVGGEISRTAQYVVVGIPILLGRYWGNGNKVFFCLCVLWFAVLALVGRRAELLAAIIALLLIIYLRASERKKHNIILVFFLAVAVLIISAILIEMNVVTYNGNNRIINSVFLLIKGADVSNGRSRLYRLAIDLFLQHPFFGIGWGNYRLYSRDILTSVTNVHNMYLQSLCEVGIIGTIVFVFLVYFLLRYTYKQFSRHKYDNLIEIVTFPMFMAVYILFLGLFDNIVYHDEFWFLEAFILFCSYRIEKGEKFRWNL